MSRVEDIKVEMYLSRWTDITADVAQDPGISISRGRQNEGTKLTTPTTCKFGLRNGEEASFGAGTYDPRWPASPYYGILGKGVPVRVGLRRAWDSFGRTVSNGWGTSDAGYAWGIVGFGGPAASDFAVGSGVATHRVPNASAYALSHLIGFSQRDAEVQVTCSLPFTLVSGGTIEPANILLRYTDSSNYNMIRVEIATDETIALKFISVVAGVETVLSSATDGSFNGTTTTGLTHSSSLSLKVRAVVENTTTRAKIWQSNQDEPFDWLWYCRSNDNYEAGSVGIRSGVAAGNTNAPVTFTYDNFEVSSPRFYGEASSIQQKQDKSGKNRWVEVEAADMLRRLQTGASPLQSALRRAVPSLANLVAYWPMEDGSVSSGAAAVTANTPPMVVTQGTVTFASNSAFEGSDKIPVPKLGTLQASVPPHALGVEVVRFLLHCPASGLADLTALATIHTQGTISRWRLVYGTLNGGSVKLQWFDQQVNFVGETGWVGFALDDRPVMFSVELQQSGADISRAVVAVAPGASSGNANSGTVTGQTLGTVTDVYLTPDAAAQNVAFGHLHVQNAFQSIFALGAPLNAWRNESAGNRALRLSKTENGVPLSTHRSTEVGEWWAKLGAQGVKTLVDLLEETARADFAVIYASRAASHLYYRTHPSIQGQQPRAALDVAAHQLETQPLPTDDDQALTNDVTATRTGGSSARAVKTSGRNSTATPAAGGVGTYDSNTTYNVSADGYLADYAAWALARGTYDGPRYPQLAVMRHAAPVADDAALFAALLDVDQGDILLIENLPLGDDRAMVLGYKETITPIEHRFVFNAEPGNLWNIGVTDAAGTRADAEGSTLAASATITATTLSVANTGVPWIDSAGYAAQFPFNIMVAGEEMTVTAVGGTSSPQTFTVTRSVNGIVKAQTSGATVQLADPVYAGLGPAL